MHGYNFTEHLRRVLAQAREQAVAMDNECVGCEHLTLALLFSEGLGRTVIQNLGVDLGDAEDAIKKSIKSKRANPTSTGPDLPYTSPAKQTLELAMNEARALNHSYVGTEHLLLGLLREEKNIGAQVLHSLGVTLDDARAEALRIVGVEMPRAPISPVPKGHDFSERAKKVLAMAREEAELLQHGYVGTEHILLAIARAGEGVAATVLQNLHADLGAIRLQIETVVQRGRSTQTTDALPFTSRAKKVIDLSQEQARELNHRYVGTEHLLLGLLAEAKGIAAQVLVSSGVTFEGARRETLRILGTEMVPAPTEPPVGEKPERIGLTLRYSNGVLVSKSFTNVVEAANFLSAQ